ncbi:flavin reductase family protein [Streptomyces roseifaciens]|uniref:flavin reductase family protein n=1 Tax=Streptomyces roseifaciens TaxID=1488406 RepID=UPI000718084A|nr:flavin reductase family protein [Streptomyces roseifaciens]
MAFMMGHAGMAALAVRYLRPAGTPAPAAPPPDPMPRPELRAVRADEQPPPAPRELRRVLGRFAGGVTVITAPGADGEPPAGFACQSFASLSLDPPLVVFMVGRTSTTWPRIARAGVFCVNVLGAGQSALCRAFAVSGAQAADKFTGVRHAPSPATGSPLLADVLAWVDCTVHAVHTGGDHLIVVGRVEALGADEAAAAAQEGPLIFYGSTFGTFTALDL